MNIRPIKTRIFREGEDLISFIRSSVPRLKGRTIIAVTSKIVALAEGRVVPLEQKESVIQKESEWALKAKWVWLTLKDGILLANAGADASNAAGKLVLLPRDSFKSAARIRKHLKRHYKIKRLGVLLTDSRVTPLRSGVIGVALGYAGFKGLRDYRGKRDIFGRKLQFSGTNVADSLATAAVVVMGEGNERLPIAVITDAPVEFVERVNRKEILISAKDDMYAQLFRRVKRKKLR